VKTEGQHKAQKGLIRVSLTQKRGIIEKVVISGDFFLYPEDSLWRLEKRLVGTRLVRKDLLAQVGVFYKDEKILSPGVAPEDFVEAVLKAAWSQGK
jgi:lipoate-protein ligase A